MAFEIIIKPILINDTTDIVSYYDKESEGLGRRFYNQFLLSLAKIENPSFYFLLCKEACEAM
jgi:hypothetical protein